MFRRSSGFTIVELLIVIVVIGILAAISIVAYNGISTKATESTLQSDLTNASKQLGLIHAEAGTYPSGLPANAKSSSGNTFHYDQTGFGTGYCLTATSSRSNAKSYHISSTSGTVSEGSCPGHPSGGGSGSGGGGTIAANTPIQNITSSQCSALPIYTGTNSDAVHTVIDTRGGTTRNYEIAKLADGNCWMLTNLKLGSTTGTIALTPADSNVSSNFTLPQLTTSGSSSSDIPRAYGPVPGDTGTGSTNYGYLYNWSAATAGETTSSITTGNAPHSICPAGWKLPTGGSGGEFAQLDVSFGGAGVYVTDGPSQPAWSISGAFKGVHAGLWTGSFYKTGSSGPLWSSSAQPGNSSGAYFLGLTPNYIAPGTLSSGNGITRANGIGVRCLLN